MDDKKIKKQKDEDQEEKIDEVQLEDKLDEKVEELIEEEDDADTEIEVLTQKVENLEDQLKRAVADYRNLENRNRDEKLEFIKFANKNLIEQLLPAFDTLLLADKYTEDQNLKITVKHILEVLKNVGIEKIEAVGKEYNPQTMEAIEVVDGDKDKVIEEIQPGFVLYGKVIRPARVKVGGEKK